MRVFAYHLTCIEVDYLHVSGPRMQIEDGDGGGRVSLDREELQQLFVLRTFITFEFGVSLLGRSAESCHAFAAGLASDA